MNIFLNTIHKVLCVPNRTMLNCLWITPVTEAHRIPTFKKYCQVTLDTFSEDGQKRNVQKDLDSEALHIFQNLRNFLLERNGYENTSAKTFHVPGYYKSEDIRNKIYTDYSYLKSEDMLRDFKIFTVNRNISKKNDNYREIIQLLTRNCSNFSDIKLYKLLEYLELWPDIGKRQHPHSSIRKLLEQIDSELNKRSQYWAVDKTLKYCDAICKTFHFRSDFVTNSLRKLTIDPSTLSYTNIVQIMYYLFLYDIPKLQIRQMEPYIEDYFDKFTIEELGIICMGFFRSQVFITSDTLLCKLMQKIIDNVDTISRQNMGQFFKEIRYSFITKPHCVKKCAELLEAIVPRVKDMHGSTLTHLSHLKAHSHIYNPRLLTAIVERFTVNLKCMRLKDIERMLFFMATFNIPSSEPLYNLIIEELGSSHRNKEQIKFPRLLAFALRHLALVNIYPLHLIEIVMSRNYMNLAYGSNPYDLGIEYFFLDQSIEIEVPEYKGQRLEKEVCNILNKKNYMPEAGSFASYFKKEIVESLSNIFNEKYAVCLAKILPHFTERDIILCLDKDNNVIHCNEILRKIKLHIKRVPRQFKNRTWIVIIFTTEALLIRGTNKFTGNLLAKIRHLQKVGYVPVVVSHIDWQVLGSNSQKREYLVKIISQVTNMKRYKNLVQKPYPFIQAYKSTYC